MMLVVVFLFSPLSRHLAVPPPPLLRYYLMCTIHCGGIVMMVLGLEIILRAEYNLFGDPAILLLVPGIIIGFAVLKRLLVLLADLLGVWRIKHANTAWHSSIGNDEDDDFLIPKCVAACPLVCLGAV